MCAPNDVWSLGVVLVNLTCGRNPWKQASHEDYTYRAFTQGQGFLKTILPVTDELNEILSRIFTANPDQRITLPELRKMIEDCSQFTEQSPASATLPQAEPVDNMVDFDMEPLSPISSDGSLSDEGSCSSNEGSDASSVSSLDDDMDDMCPEIPEISTPPPVADHARVAIYDSGDVRGPSGHVQDYMSYQQPMAKPVIHQPMPVPAPTSCAPRFYTPSGWEWFAKFAPPVPIIHHPLPFHQQVPHIFSCY